MYPSIGSNCLADGSSALAAALSVAGPATIPLPGPKDADKTIMLKADGGKAPLTWLVNGLLIGSYDRFQPALYLPQGEGNARITVVDSEGRSDTSQVRFKRDK